MNNSEKNKIPLVTVLLPVHNGATYIKSAVESILQQTFSDFELLIINDGSSDQTEKIILSIQDSRIRLINNEKNLGLIVSLNKGINFAEGKYIARMDADDLALPERLEKQVAQMESDSGIAVCATQVELINEDGEVTGNWSTDIETNSESEIRSMMMRTNCIAHPTIMIRKETALKFLYNENQKGAEDWDLWMRILSSGKRIAKIPETLLQYRVHPASIMGTSKVKETLEKRLMRIKRKFLWSEFLKLHINGFYIGVKFSFYKNLARNIVSNKIPDWGKDVKRLLTSPPWEVYSQWKNLKKVLATYEGRHFFAFPYMHVGGAEKVHAAIVAAVASEKPIVLFSGFSDNKKFLNRFQTSAIVLDVAHYINYPLTRKKAQKILSEKINATEKSVWFGSNAGLFYDLIPALNSQMKIIDLIHAFKYQPGANLAHLKLLSLASRIDARIFVSGAALEEFSKFEFHNNIPKRLRERLQLITNGVHSGQITIKELNPAINVLFVGRNSPEKRLDIFLEIANQLGKTSPGKLNFNVVGAQNPASSSSPVKFYGELTDENKIQSVYAENDFLLLTSSREGFPMVIMEAMMNGLVVISTPVGDIPNRLNGENGIVVASVDAAKVVEEMTDLLRKLSADPEKVLKLKTAARKYAVENFSEEKFVENYRKLLLY